MKSVTILTLSMCLHNKITNLRLLCNKKYRTQISKYFQMAFFNLDVIVRTQLQEITLSHILCNINHTQA